MELVLPDSELMGEEKVLLGTLRGKGLFISRDRDAKAAVLDYINDTAPAQKVTFVDRIGWQPSGAFIMPAIEDYVAPAAIPAKPKGRRRKVPKQSAHTRSNLRVKAPSSVPEPDHK